jgi:hypothetical protein
MSVGIVTRLRAKRPGFDSRQCQGLFSSSPRPDLLWAPSSPLYNEHGGFFPVGMKLTTHLDLLEVKNVWSYTSTHQILLHDTVLN